jgi:hypothetical protein
MPCHTLEGTGGKVRSEFTELLPSAGSYFPRLVSGFPWHKMYL